MKTISDETQLGWLLAVAVALGVIGYSTTARPCQCPHQSPPGLVAPMTPGTPATPKGTAPAKVPDVEALKELAGLLNDRTKETADRTWLVGVTSQHNFTVIQRGLPYSDMVFLNRDWTLTGFPNTLELTERDRDFLRTKVRTATQPTSAASRHGY